LDVDVDTESSAIPLAEEWDGSLHEALMEKPKRGLDVGMDEES